MLIARVSVAITDRIHGEQNVEMLVWLGKNVLRCP